MSYAANERQSKATASHVTDQENKEGIIRLSVIDRVVYNFVMISAIVLAAGKSERMGKNKLLLIFNGKTIIEHTVDAILGSKISETIVVLQPNVPEIKEVLDRRPIKTIENPHYADGMSTSIQAGVRAISESARGVLISLGDQPLVTADELNLLIDRFDRADKRIVAPVYKGTRGNPVIIDLCFKDEIFLLRGDIGCRSLLKTSSEEVMFVEMPTDHVLRDIDSPDDYERLCESK